MMTTQKTVRRFCTENSIYKIEIKAQSKADLHDQLHKLLDSIPDTMARCNIVGAMHYSLPGIWKDIVVGEDHTFLPESSESISSQPQVSDS